MARILLFDQVDGARALDFAEVEAPKPGPGEIRYRVDAFALNRSDLLFLNDEHYSVASLPSRIGTEACGVVDAVGPDAVGFAVGDRVTSIPFHNTAGTDRNVAGEFAITPERYLMAWPSGLTAPQACSITMQYLTAYYPLCEIARLQPGDRLLVTAASSSAGLAAIQIGRMLGCFVIAQTRTGDKSSALVQAGADEVVVSDSEDMADAILSFTGGEGVRVVYDPVGGSFLDRYVDALAVGAQVFLYGTLASPRLDLGLVELVRKKPILYPHSLYNHVSDPSALTRGTDWLLKNVEAGHLRPIIDSVYQWDKALEAYRYLGEHRHTGKVVVSIA